MIGELTDAHMAEVYALLRETLTGFLDDQVNMIQGMVPKARRPGRTPGAGAGKS